MIVTKLAVMGGIVVLGVLCWLAAAGFTALGIVLITAAALFVMVAGGNWLSGRSQGSATGAARPGKVPPSRAPGRRGGR